MNEAIVQAAQPLLTYGWNTRILTQDDFDAITERGNIYVIDWTMTVDVEYAKQDGRDVLLVNNKLRRARRLAILWHGLAHVYQGMYFACRLLNTTHDECLDAKGLECDAHIVAACAVLPRPIFERKTAREIQKQYSICDALLQLRYQILWRYDI